jgi:hypothetical protein
MRPRTLSRITLAAVLASSCAAKAPKPPVVAAVRPPAPDPLAGAVRQDGFVPLWHKQEHVWLGIEKRRLDEQLLFCFDSTRGMGEHEPQLNGNNVGRCVVAYFHQTNDQLQLRALNTRYTARAGSPEMRAVRESFSDSLIGAAVLLPPAPSAPGMLVVDASGLLLADIPGFGSLLEETYRQPYAFDSRSSGFGDLRVSARETSVDVTAHFRLARVVLPSQGSTAPRVPLPGTLVDDRSLFLGLQYRFARLPVPYARRPADDRIGHFAVTRYDYSDDLNADARVHYVTRWRLELANPSAEKSRPRHPITYYLDANIPERYRATVRAAILAWNAPFERIGFTEAIEVRDAPADMTPDSLPMPYGWIRWFMQAGQRASARGGIVTDPRTGEILHAHIVIPDNWMRGVRSTFLEDHLPTVEARQADACAYGETAAEELGFALELLDARGDLAADGPEAEEIVQAVLKEVVMHEVGHTLGLTHNFRASTAYRQEQLDDPEFTRTHGIAGSVMDYNPINLGLHNRPHGDYAMSRPGPYDEWALEYAYRPFAPDQETAALARLAARGGEPSLAYSNDTEAGEDDLLGIDPEVNRRDLGSDQLAFARRRFALSRELWQHLAEKHVSDGDSEEVVRRAFERAFGGVSQAARLSAKHVGGVIHLRDHAGGRAPFAPVAAGRQRQALALLETEVLSPDAFRFPPRLLNRLAVNGLMWNSPDPTYRLHDNVVALQRGVLAHLLGAGVAGRLVEMESRVPAPEAFHLAELYDRLQVSVWKELETGGDISPLRRSLQRLHLDLLVRLALRSSADVPEDARSLARANLRALAALLHRARRQRLGPEARAHLDDSQALVERALNAPLQAAVPG